MRINRKRTHYPEHIKREIQREKIKLYHECEKLMPLLDEEMYVTDPIITNSLVDPSPSPEALLISKDIFSLFSDEAREVAKIILACPEEFFLRNGRIKKSSLRKECRTQLGWGPRRTDNATFEMGAMLQACI